MHRTVLLAWPLVCLSACPAAQAQGGRGGVGHLRVEGDIDSAAMVRGLRESLGELEDRELIVLELSGDSARPDLVRELGALIRGLGQPVRVWLNDEEGGRVGVDQLLLALQAGEAFIAPGVRVVSGADLTGLAPEETDWERVRREVAAPVWLRLHAMNERAAPIARALAFAEPVRVRRAGVMIASADARHWDAAWTVVVDDDGRVDVGAELLVELGLARDAVHEGSVAGEGARIVGRPSSVRSTLADAHRGTVRVVAELGDLLDEIDDLLKARPNGRSKRAAEAQAIGRATPVIRAATAGLTLLERSLDEHPELAALPLHPDAPEEPGPENRREWEKALEDMRTRFADVRERYEALSGG